MRNFVRIQYNPAADTGAGGADTSSNSGSGSSIWENIFSSLPGTLMGTAAVITAAKGNNQQNTPASYYPNQYYQSQPSNNMLLWLVIGLGVIGALFFFLRK